jgi:hypothetical protein
MEEGSHIQPAANNPVTEAKGEIHQIRQTVIRQVADLKQQIHRIQEQSLRTMHEMIDSVFRTHTSENLQQLTRNEQDNLHRLDHLSQAAGSSISGTLQPGSASTSLQGEPVMDAGRQAMDIASRSVEQAMQSALDSVKDAESAVGNPGRVPDPGA